MRKKTLSWLAAVAIIAMVSAAFLRPARSSDIDAAPEVIALNSEPTPLTLIGEDAELFGAELLGGWIGGEEAGIRFRMWSKESGKYYTLGNLSWNFGAQEGNILLGYVERLGAGGWEQYSTVYENLVRFQVFDGEVFCVIVPEDETPPAEFITSTLPLHEPGRYRVMYTAREYIPTGRYDVGHWGSSGDGVYEVGFEYTVPDWDDGEVICAQFTRRGVEYADLSFAVSSDRELFVRDGTLKLEMLGDDGAYTEVEGVVDYTGGALMGYRHTDDKILPLVIIRTFHFSDGEENGEYRLSMELAEHADGSGERYTLRLRLNFSQEGME